jgi:carboxyl-terminal processing protease
VIRVLFLFCLCLAGPARAQGRFVPAFDTEALANVQTEAFDFMLPRALDAVTAGQLVSWGLGGLTSIDPSLSILVRDSNILLLMQGRTLLEVAAQGPDTSGSWARASATVVAAAYAASPVLRQAGQAAITKSFFDEMLAHLDPYSRYIPPVEAATDRDRRLGHAGIGVNLVQHGRTVSVRDVVIGSPGALAGIGPGDVIQWVNGRTALNRDLKAVNDLLSGPEGTELRMGWISRDGTSRGATMTRVMLPPETVFPRRSGDVVIIQITGFSQTTDQHVTHVIRDGLRSSRPITGVVLDLRGNRGGLLRSAVATASTFLPAGVVVRSSGRAPETTRVWMSGGGELVKGVRVVVLVDGGTASAAEILAAALADRGRAVVMGSSTFGKGVVQTIDPLPDGGELFLTWSRILAPRGWPIQSLGVMPQFCTSLGDESVRWQFAGLSTGTLQMQGAVRAHRAARAPLTPDQIVAIRERCPAADPREQDVAVAQALIDNPSSYAAALLEPMPDER